MTDLNALQQANDAGSEVPPWLKTMREVTGTKETPGDADNPVILHWCNEIAAKYPEYAAYCRTYTHDSIAWCGLTMALVMARNGIKPVKEFLWADNWRLFGTKLETPRLGCVLTFKRTGGNHVALYEGEEGPNYIIRGGNQSDSVSLTKKAKIECTGMVWPNEVAAIAPAPAPPVGENTVSFRALVPDGYFSSTPFDKSIPASIRTNNPGALNIAEWIKASLGYVGDKVTSMSGASPNSTVIFSAPEYGVAAWWRLLEKYRAAQVSTVGGIIKRYGGGQDYSAYVKQVAEWSGLTENTEIKLRSDDATLLKFAKAMFRYEAGRPSPLSDAQIMAGLAIARGSPVSSAVIPQVTPAKPMSTTTAVVVATTAAATGTAAVAVHQSLNWPAIGLTAFIIGGLATAVVLLIRKFRT